MTDRTTTLPVTTITSTKVAITTNATTLVSSTKVTIVTSATSPTTNDAKHPVNCRDTGSHRHNAAGRQEVVLVVDIEDSDVMLRFVVNNFGRCMLAIRSSPLGR